ncbi:head maturation protease, ClpP-related [Aminobacter aminovorans]|uniref:ATP-dependent Clp protease proteolytic subunit n=1 Tax=Aminobacter aminovorans TaxID=83263 RepID=A0AAC8YMK2_AMIAI|nr:head maturation protease, ClpP-related [Aminobacter aminovorans]AMS41170.1 ATP-dependent Clp protease proteolytic subunit [Aminobacter aminovorans]MBB3705848.1 ATP-dependent Clp protease protease subunit [Aminobacter aminovorans]
MSVHKNGGAKASGGYRVVARSSDRAEIYVYGIIGQDWFGDGVTAKQFAEDLKKLGNVKTIDLRINSDGGVVTEARAMYNLLVEHKAKVITHIDGIAASAASFLAMAGEDIEIAEGGFFMIHNARMSARGTAEDFERAATILRTVNETIVETYAARTKNTAADLKKWMDAETWFTGKEAVEKGFANRVVANMQVAASLNNPDERFVNLPGALRPRRNVAASRLAALAR